MVSKRLVAIVTLLLLIGALQAALNTPHFGISSNALPSTEGSPSLSKGTSENVTVHEGDLVIGGIDMYVIENCTYIQAGNIIIKDNASLTIGNATLMLTKPLAGQYELTLENFGELRMDNAILKSQGRFSVWAFGMANIDMNLTAIEDWMYCFGNSTLSANLSTIRVLSVGDDSVVNASDSMLDDLYFIPSAPIDINNLKGGFCKYWSLHENQTYAGKSEIVLQNSTVNKWSFTFNYDATITDSVLGFDCDAANINEIGIVVENSTIKSLGLRLVGSSEVSINGSIPGFHEYYDLSEHAQGIKTSLVLKETEVIGWELLAAWSTIVTLRDSTLEGLKCTENSRIILNSSTIGLPRNPDAFWFSNFAGIVILEDALVNGGVRAEMSDFLLTGNVIFTDDAYVSTWESTEATRTYDIIVVNMTTPQEGASLALVNQNGSIVWNGTADDQGRTNFNVTFTDSNYTDTLRLEASKGNLSAGQNITLLGNTPVIIKFVLGDINGDSIVDMKDVGTAARAFMTQPADPYWNPHADITGPEPLVPDGKVDMRDISLVARHFGEHYP